MGLRYTKDQVDEFTKGISAMILGIRGIEESTVYQEMLERLLDASSWADVLGDQAKSSPG